MTVRCGASTSETVISSVASLPKTLRVSRQLVPTS